MLKAFTGIFIAASFAFYIGLYFAFSAGSMNWSTVAPSTLPRFEGAGALVDDKLYLFFGYINYIESEHLLVSTNDVSSYNAGTDLWSKHSGAPLSGSHLHGVYDGEYVWFAGGFRGDHPGPAIKSVWKYHPRTDSWVPGPDLPAARGGGSLVLAERELHYIGGYFAADKEPSSHDHWVLDIEKELQGWRTEPDLPVSRGHAGGAAIGKYIYIIGGSLTHHPTWIDTQRVDRYDIKADRWERVKNLPYPASHFEPGTYVSDGKIYIAGGRNGESGSLSENELQDILVYSPEYDKWWLAGSLPEPIRAPIVRKVKNRIIVSTGSTHWAQKPQRKTYSLSCLNNSQVLCTGNEPDWLDTTKLWLKSLYKELASVLPWRIQELLRMQDVATWAGKG